MSIYSAKQTVSPQSGHEPSTPVQDEFVGNLLSFGVSFQSKSKFVKYSLDEIFARKMNDNYVVLELHLMSNLAVNTLICTSTSGIILVLPEK